MSENECNNLPLFQVYIQTVSPTWPAKSLVSGLIRRKQEIEALFLPTFRSALILSPVYLGHV